MKDERYSGSPNRWPVVTLSEAKGLEDSSLCSE